MLLLVESSPSFGEARAQRFLGPGPRQGLSGWGTEAGRLLISRVGDGGGDERGQIGRDGPALELQLLGRAAPVLVVDLIVHPVAEEQLLITAQFHQGVLVRHKYNCKKGSAFLVA
jgi:hypothetical protein